MKKLVGVSLGMTLLVVMTLLCLASSATAQNLILNGSFEANNDPYFPEVPTGTWTTIVDTWVGGWTVGYSFDTGNEYPVQLEIWDTLYGPAADGTQYVELDGWDPTRISQTPTTEVGKCYELSYAWSPRPGITDNQLQVYVGGSLFAYHTASGSSNTITVWTPETEYFSAETPSTEIAFAEVGPDDQYGMLLDAVSLRKCQPITVQIDIKPGSYPNCFNINGNGVIPVAILGSADFDVTKIDPTTLSFAGLAVRVKGNGAPQCSFKDVSGNFLCPEGAPDGYLDMVCQFVDDPSMWEPDDGQATLTGGVETEYGLTLIQGSDSICIRPPEA